jgi:pyridoxamine 5'-phosphate oxidase
MIPESAPDLDMIYENCWKMLAIGAANRRSALHQAVVATIDPDGAPETRTMVLRLIDRLERIAQFHTDRRAAKLDHLARDDRASLLFYDPGSRIQLRLGGRISVHQDDSIAEAGWARTQAMSRVCYAAKIAPGAVIDAPDAALEHLSEAERAGGYENFAVLRFHAQKMEWLSLAAAGHRRARFTLAGTAPVGQWLAP